MSKLTEFTTMGICACPTPGYTHVAAAHRATTAPPNLSTTEGDD